MKPTDAIPLVDGLVDVYGQTHYITTPDMRRMASAVIAEMEPPPNVPGVTARQVIDAFRRVRESRADPRRS